MNIITFNNVELHLQPHTHHEFLLTNKEVALGYGITQSTLRSNFNNNKDELIEGKHWLRLEVQTKGGKQKVIHWTKKGIVRLGFFIKSENAKKFRDWADDYIVNNIAENTPYIHQLERENIELRRSINRLSLKSHSEEFKKIEFENKRLKQTLIDFKNRYHTIVQKADNQIEAMRAELEKMTNVFQMLPSLANDGKNLNTDTVAKHSYW